MIKPRSINLQLLLNDQEFSPHTRDFLAGNLRDTRWPGMRDDMHHHTLRLPCGPEPQLRQRRHSLSLQRR